MSECHRACNYIWEIPAISTWRLHKEDDRTTISDAPHPYPEIGELTPGKIVKIPSIPQKQI